MISSNIKILFGSLKPQKFIFKIKRIIFKFILLFNIYLHLLDKNSKYRLFEKEGYSNFSLDKGYFTKNELLLIPKYHKYIEISKKLLLIETIPNYEIIPEITIILPVYNQETFLPRVIRNIQNQSFKLYEILFINDASTDRSLEIIKEYQNEDNRIKILQNKKNFGCAYSRANGIKFSIGKYIIFIDPDDLFFNPEILNKIYNRALADDIDMIQFHLIRYINGRYTIYQMIHEEMKGIMKQPEIRKYWYSNSTGSVEIADWLIYCKLVKREKFLELVLLMNDILIKKHNWNYYDDTAFSIVLFNIVNSYFYTKNLGYYREIHKNSLTGKKDYFMIYSRSKGYILLIETISKIIDLNNELEQTLLLSKFQRCCSNIKYINTKYINVTNDYLELGFSILDNINVNIIYKKKYKEIIGNFSKSLRV